MTLVLVRSIGRDFKLSQRSRYLTRMIEMRDRTTLVLTGVNRESFTRFTSLSPAYRGNGTVSLLRFLEVKKKSFRLIPLLGHTSTSEEPWVSTDSQQPRTGPLSTVRHQDGTRSLVPNVPVPNPPVSNILRSGSQICRSLRVLSSHLSSGCEWSTVRTTGRPVHSPFITQDPVSRV